MKNLILFFLWIAFFVLIIFNFKAEETNFVFYCSLVLAIIPTFLFLSDLFCYIRRRTNRTIYPTVGVLIFVLIIGIISLIFYFLPDRHAFNFVVLMWILSVASKKLSKGGIIEEILDMGRLFYSYTEFDEVKSKNVKKYSFTNNIPNGIRNIFLALSPFHLNNK